MSIIMKPEKKIRCVQCQQHIRPIWTMQAIWCPCCDHIFTFTTASVNLDGSPTSTAVGSDSAGNRQCQKMERFYDKVKVKISGSSDCFSNLPSSVGYRLDATSRSIRFSELSRRKRAVICGVTYKKSRYEVKGTINDVKSMKQLLIGRFGFLEENILVLTEYYRDERKIPTKKNIQDALEWLVRDSRSGDSLVFYFSGHGLRLPEYTKGDELDGFDETICPVDFTEEGMILDDEINSRIVWPLKKGVTLDAIVDSCHSGTILDLPNVYDYRLV